MDTNRNIEIGWTTKRAAEHLGVSPRFVVSLVNRNKIIGRKFGPLWVIDPQSVEDYKNTPKDKGGRPRKMSD